MDLQIRPESKVKFAWFQVPLTFRFNYVIYVNDI